MIRCASDVQRILAKILGNSPENLENFERVFRGETAGKFFDWAALVV
jgi:hypothetical protein